MAEPSTTSSVFPYLIVRNVISSTLPAGRFNVTGRKQNNTGKEQPCPNIKWIPNGSNPPPPPFRRPSPPSGRRSTECIRTSTVSRTPGVAAHPGIHRLRRRRSAGVPTVRFRLNSITAVIRSGTPADIRKGLRPSTGRSPSHRGKSVLRHPLLQRATALRWQIPGADQ